MENTAVTIYNANGLPNFVRWYILRMTTNKLSPSSVIPVDIVESKQLVGVRGYHQMFCIAPSLIGVAKRV